MENGQQLLTRFGKERALEKAIAGCKSLASSSVEMGNKYSEMMHYFAAVIVGRDKKGWIISYENFVQAVDDAIRTEISDHNYRKPTHVHAHIQQLFYKVLEGHIPNEDFEEKSSRISA